MLTNAITELEFHVSGFIAKVNGVWTENALNQFRDFLTRRGFHPSDDELITALRRAQEKYLDGPGYLSVCAAKPCWDKISFDLLG
jgi:hypothetical protein